MERVTPVLHAPAGETSRRTRLRGIAVRVSHAAALALGTLLTVCGCTPEQKTQMATEQTPQHHSQPRDMLSRINASELISDPTGLRDLQRQQKETLAAARAKIEALDVDGLNQVVAELGVLAAQVRERLEAVPPEKLAEASDSWAGSAVAVREQIEQVRLQETIEEIRATVEALRQQLEATLGDANELVARTGERVDAVPLEELKKSLNAIESAAAQVPAMSRRLDALLTAWRIMALVATGVLAMWGVCGLSYLLRRRGRAAD